MIENRPMIELVLWGFGQSDRLEEKLSEIDSSLEQVRADSYLKDILSKAVMTGGGCLSCMEVGVSCKVNHSSVPHI